VLLPAFERLAVKEGHKNVLGMDYGGEGENGGERKQSDGHRAVVNGTRDRLFRPAASVAVFA
jgi:hypothetical protein